MEDKWIQQLRSMRQSNWRNPKEVPAACAIAECELTLAQVQDASDRLARFAPFFRAVFPETGDGILESPLREIPAMQTCLEKEQGPVSGKLWLKLDSHLPVSGSIKARGGIYEILKYAETLALEAGLLSLEEDYSAFAAEPMRKMLSEYSVAVGSTGNLGLSIGIISAALGFRVTVHMSADARKWKKELLRSRGVTVMEYESDYSQAVAQGRAQAAGDPKCHFVDDENSRDLFLGYAVAALRLKEQLKNQKAEVDEAHPLYVYLPCGVGGGPGGVAFGLKLVYGDAVKCFFAEPTHAPCMLLGLATGKHHEICVADIGLDGHTAADGLAVGRASGFVGRLIEPFLSGCYTVSDERLYCLLADLTDTEGICLEPSALAGLEGLLRTEFAPEFREFSGKNAIHLAWATGGSMVPPRELEQYYKMGEVLRRRGKL